MGQGKHAEAEPLYEQCQATEEKVLGSEHPSLAVTLKNRAGLLYKQVSNWGGGVLLKAQTGGRIFRDLLQQCSGCTAQQPDVEKMLQIQPFAELLFCRVFEYVSGQICRGGAAL